MSSHAPSPRSAPVVGIGASAGGVQPLITLVGALPEDFAAAVLITLHLRRGDPNALPRLLDRAGALRVVSVRDGALAEPGVAYVARPGEHLSLASGRLRSTHGPRVKGHRPAIDLMLRSLAHERGAAAIGVILSGTLDDGSRGAVAIKEAGGRVFVQDAGEARYPGMVTSTERIVDVDGAYPAELLAAALVRAVRTPHHS